MQRQVQVLSMHDKSANELKKKKRKRENRDRHFISACHFYNISFPVDAIIIIIYLFILLAVLIIVTVGSGSVAHPKAESTVSIDFSLAIIMIPCCARKGKRVMIFLKGK